MDDPSNLSEGNAYRPIEGMELVIATVSGYHGTERFKLIKLIAHAGANYVGAMTKSTTHLVCWRFEGKKYNLAKNIGAHIISHRWFEDCLKERKRLPEDSYSMQSGQETGSMTWVEPAFLNTSGEGKCSMPTNRRSKAVDVDASLDWPESNVLSRHTESSHFPNLRLSSNRRNLFDDNQDDITYGSASRSHCLKKKTYCDLSNYIDPSQKQGTCSKKSRTRLTDSDSTSGNNLRNRLEKDGIEEILLDNNFRDLNSSLDNRLSSDNEHHEERIETLDSCNDGMKDNEPHKENDSLIEHGGQNQAEVSCVICWTEFSATRAVLPCGHRFCYTCIQGWADCMASNGKPSTCPLCKASFTSIKRMENSSTDQKIYSQTIPGGSPNRDICKLSSEGNDKDTTLPVDYVCYECLYHEPVDLLVCCQICKSKWVHSCCLNPPSIPWTCIHCRDLRTLYRLFSVS